MCSLNHIRVLNMDDDKVKLLIAKPFIEKANPKLDITLLTPLCRE